MDKKHSALWIVAAGLPVTVKAAMPLGSDAHACVSGRGPALQTTMYGLKDRAGRLKLKHYPADKADFLKRERDLKREGTYFGRVRAETPAGGSAALCIKVPAPGRFALIFTHDRDDKNKLNFYRDGAGLPGNAKLGRHRPTLAQATNNVGRGVTVITIRTQYLRGMSGFGPAIR